VRQHQKRRRAEYVCFIHFFTKWVKAHWVVVRVIRHLRLEDLEIRIKRTERRRRSANMNLRRLLVWEKRKRRRKDQRLLQRFQK